MDLRHLSDDEAARFVYKGATVVTLFRGRWNSHQRNKALSERVKHLELLLEEACDLMEEAIDGNYEPDSFTTQPWREALKDRVI